MPATHTAHHSGTGAQHSQYGRMAGNHYLRLIVMTALSFAAMYVLMYAMVDRFDSVYNSINQVYMAGLMAAAMVVIELAVMGSMYRNGKLNIAIVAISLAALVACWALIRTQGAVDDRQFLRSMIPHHSGAILMCEKAAIRDPEITELCKAIIVSQVDEIRQMKAKLDALNQ